MKFSVRVAALTDLSATIEVEAETADRALEIIREQIENGTTRECGIFELNDNGIDPIAGTLEPIEVCDDGGIVLESPMVNGARLAALFGPPPLAEAIDKSEIDTAIAPIQQLLGITSGDVAAQCFSGIAWSELNPTQRRDALAKWLAAECLHAGAP